MSKKKKKKALTARRIREEAAAKDALSAVIEEAAAEKNEPDFEYIEIADDEPKKEEIKAPAEKEPEKAEALPEKEEDALEIKELVVTQHSTDNGGTVEIALAELTEEKTKPEPVKAAAEKPKPEKTAEKKPEKAGEKVKAKPKKAKKAKKETEKPLKPVFAMANIVYTSIFFVGVTLALLFLPRSTVSNIEQRELAKFPEFSWEDFVNGKFTDGITEFYDDTVPYRDPLKKAAAAVKKLYGVELRGAQIYGQLAAITEEPDVEPIPEQTAPAQTTAPAKTTAPDKTNAPDKTTTAGETTAKTTTTAAETTKKHVNEIAEGVITNGQVVTRLDDGHYWGISLFGGGNGQTYAAALNRFHKELGDDVTIYSMVIPTAGEYYLPSAYDAYNASHAKSINKINAQLDEDIIAVDAVSALGAHTSEPIYTRTDHHWQPLGAYYAAQAFAEAADVPFMDISEYEKVVIDGYVGTMYSFTNDVNLLNDPEQFVYYKPDADYKTYYYDTAYNFDYQFPLFVGGMPVGSSYSTFMGGDKKIVRIETENKNGRKLLIFKDSYGNAEIPFYVTSFEEVYVCDMRYFDLNAVEFIKEHGITDLMFTMCTFSAVGSNANGLNKVLDNPVSAQAEETLAPPVGSEE